MRAPRHKSSNGNKSSGRYPVLTQTYQFRDPVLDIPVFGKMRRGGISHGLQNPAVHRLTLIKLRVEVAAELAVSADFRVISGGLAMQGIHDCGLLSTMLVINAFLLYTTLTSSCQLGIPPRSTSCSGAGFFTPQVCRQGAAIRITIAPVRDTTMEWTTPQFEELCLNCEINSYASASL